MTLVLFLLMLAMIANAVPVIDTHRAHTIQTSTFESHETGWFGLNAEWAQRIYIGKSEGDTGRWLSQMQNQYYKQKVNPLEGSWDEGLGNPEFMMIRIGTLGLLCQGKQASCALKHLQSRIVEVESSCPTPTITQDETLWTVSLSDSKIADWLFQGGQPVYNTDSLQFIICQPRLHSTTNTR